MIKRPPPPVRYLVLLAALFLLVTAVCSKSKQDTTTPQAPVAPDAGAMQQTPTASDAGVPATDAAAANKPDQKFFPATKSAGGLF